MTALLNANENFLPQNYEVPKESKQFMKLEQGPNTIRILSKPMLGYLIFDKDNKPYRKPFEDGNFTEEDFNAFEVKKDEEGKSTKPRHFWMFLVWNYRKSIPQVLEITQKSIMDSIIRLNENQKFGNPIKYDIEITKKGNSRFDTEYSVLGIPPEPLADEIKEVLELLGNKYNPELVFQSEYPIQNYNF